MKKNHQNHEEEGGEAWLLPYSDLMTLLLAVFIVLFAVSQVDQAKAEAIAGAFQAMFGEGIPGGGAGGGNGASYNPNIIPPDLTAEPPTEEDSEKNDTPNVHTEYSEYDNFADLERQFRQYLEDEKLTSVVNASIDERGLVISLNMAVLFESGRADITQSYEGILIHIGQIMNKMPNYIRIEGHTDNIPMASEVYPSNWELGAARAARVARLFIDKAEILPGKVSVVSYADTKPITANNTDENRAKNRRVDLILLSAKYNSLEEDLDDVKEMEHGEIETETAP